MNEITVTRTAVRDSDGAVLVDRCVYRPAADDDRPGKIHDIAGHDAVVLIRVEGDDIVDHHAAAIRVGEQTMRGVVFDPATGGMVEQLVTVPLLDHPARIEDWPVRHGVTITGVTVA